MNGTLYQAQHNYQEALADNMVFWSSGNEDLAGAVELKSRNPSPGTIEKQLQHAAQIMEQLIGPSWPHDVPFAAAVLQRKVSPIAQKAIGQKKVRFRGRNHRIQVKSCGTEFERLVFTVG